MVAYVQGIQEERSWRNKISTDGLAELSNKNRKDTEKITISDVVRIYLCY